ncbi:MAG: ATP-grasp domain-containing protein [Candidatus Nanohaloarchaea archaeon]
MKLQEHEAKELLEEYGLSTPSRQTQNSDGLAVKAQALLKNRKELGGVRFAESENEAERISEDLEDRELDGREVESVLIEEKVDFSSEYYVAFMYDTDTRSPVLLFSTEGGSGIEDRNVKKLEIGRPEQWRIREFLKDNDVDSSRITDLASSIHRAARCFFDEDARMVEINPLAWSKGEPVVLDAMVDLDEDASYRHDWNYPERSDMGREKTEREKKAENIDEDDHRGIAGKYTELDGDIGMMLAGGGASLTNMDALLACGGQPANYTEYGGNPPAEKVYRLSKIIMSKPLNGLWHVGGTANNTDIYRTMKGFCRALKEEKPDYPIVVRRDGPSADRGFELLRETRAELGLDMDLYRNDKPMTETAEELVEKVKEYKEGSK